jgi:hypothetical protein
MTIYYIRKGQEGPIKIGFTKRSAEKRMLQLQTGHHERLFLIGTSPGEFDDEQAIHKELKDYRLAGEWFEPKPELLSAIKDIVENQHPWYFFRKLTFAAFNGAREMLEELFEDLHKKLALKDKRVDSKFELLNGEGVPKDRMVDQLTRLRAKCRELQAMVDELQEENKALREREMTVLPPVGTGERAKTRDRAHPAAMPSDNRQFSLEL